MDGLYIMENPIKMDDLGVPLFLETPSSISRCLVPAWLSSCLASQSRGLSSRNKMLRGFGGSHWSGTRQVLACFSWVPLTFELCNVVVM